MTKTAKAALVFFFVLFQFSAIAGFFGLFGYTWAWLGTATLALLTMVALIFAADASMQSKANAGPEALAERFFASYGEWEREDKPYDCLMNSRLIGGPAVVLSDASGVITLVHDDSVADLGEEPWLQAVYTPKAE